MNQTAHPQPAAAAGVTPARDNDMTESPDEWPALKERLEKCRQIIEPIYKQADARAAHHQKTHARVTIIAAVCGTLAVTVAILGLALGNDSIGKLSEPVQHFLKHAEHFLGKLEPVALVIAVVAIAAGLWSLRLPRWLIERYKAERCRLLKFGALIDPALWSGNKETVAQRLNRLEADAKELEQTATLEDSEKWLLTIHSRESLTEAQLEELDKPALAELVRYYTDVRLGSQLDYFHRKIKQFALRDHITRVLPQWMFFLSVIAALVHFAMETLEHGEGHDGHGAATMVGIGLLLAALAALLPVWGAGLRTYRMANEFGRNVKRFESARHFLREKLQELEKSPDVNGTFRILWECEHYLENEHREWLRLMAETEWFG